MIIKTVKNTKKLKFFENYQYQLIDIGEILVKLLIRK